LQDIFKVEFGPKPTFRTPLCCNNSILWVHSDFSNITVVTGLLSTLIKLPKELMPWDIIIVGLYDDPKIIRLFVKCNENLIFY